MVTLIFYQKQFFDVVPISATGFLPPESNATTTPTSTTPGISTGVASTTSPLNTGDVGSGKSGQQVCLLSMKNFNYCTFIALLSRFFNHFIVYISCQAL